MIAIGVLAKVDPGDFGPRIALPQRFSWADVFASVAPMVPPTQGLPDVGLWNARAFVRLEVAVLGWALIAAPVAVLARDARTDADDDHDGAAVRCIAVAAIAGALLVGPVLVVVNATSPDSYLGQPPPARMAMSVLPAIVACLALAVRRPWSRHALCALTGVGLLYALIAVA